MQNGSGVCTYVYADKAEDLKWGGWGSVLPQRWDRGGAVKAAFGDLFFCHFLLKNYSSKSGSALSSLTDISDKQNFPFPEGLRGKMCQ